MISSHNHHLNVGSLGINFFVRVDRIHRSDQPETGFEDAGGRVIYQLGAKAQCGNCASENARQRRDISQRHESRVVRRIVK